MSNYVMIKWSNPLNPSDEQLLCSWVYDKDLGWIGKRFQTEEEAEIAAKEYIKYKNNRLDVGYAPEITYNFNELNKLLMPLPIKLKKH